MRVHLKMMGTVLLLGSFLTATGGCAALKGDRDAKAKSDSKPTAVQTEKETTKPAAAQENVKPAEPTSETKAAEPAAKALSADDLKKKQDELKKKEKELKKKDRNITKLERNLQVAQLKLEKTKISQEQSRRREQVNLAKTEAELDLAQQRYQNFMEKSLPSRIAWQELTQKRVADNVKEAQEELEQIEMMYRQDEVDEKTKEIVVERSRVRLERSQRDQDLRRIDFETMMNLSIPIEKREQEMSLQEKEQALERLKESMRLSELDEKINLMGAEDEITRLQYDLDDARDELADLKEDIAKLEKEIAEAQPEKSE